MLALLNGRHTLRDNTSTGHSIHLSQLGEHSTAVGRSVQSKGRPETPVSLISSTNKVIIDTKLFKIMEINVETTTWKATDGSMSA